MGRGRLIALRQISLKKFQPHLFARIAFRAWMAEALTNGFQTLLDIVMQTSEKLGQRTIRS